jgi:hypothetical protein
MASKAIRNYSGHLEFGTRRVNRVTGLKLAARKVGLVRQLNGRPSARVFIGFNRREMKRRDVAELVGDQPTRKTCTLGLPFWFRARICFDIGGEITNAEWRKYLKQHYRRS